MQEASGHKVVVLVLTASFWNSSPQNISRDYLLGYHVTYHSREEDISARLLVLVKLQLC